MFAFTSASGQEYQITHNGLTRTYRLHLPSDYRQNDLHPLIINMHGLGSNAIEQELYSGMNLVSDTAGFIVAYPNAVGGIWNVSSTSGTDDVGFISALIDTLAAAYSIDLYRVYATGMSMGGFMSYRLACELEARVAAIASVTGLLAFSPCNPDRPVPVLQIHGTADPIVPYSGVPATVNHWVSHNQCPAEPVITDLPDVNTTDNSTITVYYYGLCNDATEVTLYTINGGAHTWPGAQIIIGVTNQDINASSEIWNFFRKYSLAPNDIDQHDRNMEHATLRFFPNPVMDYATLEVRSNEFGIASFRLIDFSGREMYTQSIRVPGSTLIRCGHLPRGLYLAELEQSGSVVREKILVR